ncbi:MAG TPA: polysaccharide deacetylase family protein [Terriglobales bacterium]|nr:polysaccharide deacetylase family protein [Terriglobales bacterium]
MNRIASELRWHLKKAARRACLSGSSLLSVPQSGVRILTYHRFANAHHDPFAVAPPELDRQMEWLAESGLGLSLGTVLEALAGERPLPDQGVLVTIDDGFASTHSVALPILAKYRIPAVAFVPPGLIIEPPADDPEPRLTWSQIRELGAAGVEIASHGWSHTSFGSMDVEQMRTEAVLSRLVLEDHTGSAVRAFAYPFGTRADYSAASARVMREAGYRCAFTSQHGPVRPGMAPYELPRVKIEGGENLQAFANSCRGGLDAWAYVDRCLWTLQQRQA